MQNSWVATPYRENAVVSIAATLAAAGSLGQFVTTLQSAQLLRWSRHVPGRLGTLLERELRRRAFAQVEPELISSCGVAAELAHVLVRRLLGGSTQSSAMMYWVKRRFDQAVARRLQKADGVDVVVGMYGACESTFRIADRIGAFKVLHFVNSRPCEHNRILREMAGLSSGHHEMIPVDVERRVEAEIEAADLILVPSNFVAKQFGDSGKVAIIPYGVDLESFGASQRSRSAGRLECLCVAQIGYRKGIKILIEAARRLGDRVRVNLVGPLVSREVLNDLPANVNYQGAVPPGGVPLAMQRADIFVLPTLEDACALVTLEAMACGLPVVTTHNNGSAELIDDGVDGFVVPSGDVDALCARLTGLLDAPSLLREVGGRARGKVGTSHSWHDYGQRVLAAIEARTS